MAKKRFEGDYTINTIKNIIVGDPTSGSNYKWNRRHPAGHPGAGTLQGPLALSVMGPPTIRRITDRVGNIPYVVSNGGNPLSIPTATT